MNLNIKKNRKMQKYTLKVQILRVIWGFFSIIFHLIPRPFYKTRNIILTIFGAKIGKNVQISNSAKIYFPWELQIGDFSSIGDNALIYNLALVIIGHSSTISQRAHLCTGTHDFESPSLELLKKPIVLGDNVWVCADCFISPGLNLKSGSIVGAGSVLTCDIDEYSIVAGNPAKFIKKRTIKNA